MSALLSLNGVHTHVGAYHILHGVEMDVPEGQLTLLTGAVHEVVHVDGEGSLDEL